MSDSTNKISPDARLDVSRVLLINTVMPLLALLFVVGLFAVQLWRVNETSAWVGHTFEVLRRTNLASAHLQRMSASQRGYMLTMSQELKQPYEESLKEVWPLFTEIEAMVADNPAQQQAMRDLETQARRWQENSERLIAMRVRNDPNFLKEFIDGPNSGLMAKLWEGMDTFRDTERGLLSRRQEKLVGEGRVIGALGGIGVVGVMGFFVLFSRRQHRMLDEVYRKNRDQIERQRDELALHARQLQEFNEELQARNEEIQAQSEELQAQNEEIQAQSEELQTQNEEIQAQSEELMHQNDQLVQLTAKAESANRLKSEFLANMSHELRTPLNSIIGYTELVVLNKKLTLEERVSRNLNVVLRNARHLLSLINDILDLSKVEAGKVSVYAEPVSVAQMLSTVVATAEPLSRAKGLKLDVVVEPGLETVVTDETKVRQIVLNLVSNAVKFTREGRVSIRARADGPEGFAIDVQDTGVGIAPEHLDMVFEEFRQVDASTTREAGGTGLGLAIARKLARLLGGDLLITDSAVDAGTTFTLSLPRVLPGYMPTLARQTAVVPELGPRDVVVAAGNKRMVVAIDDDPEMLELIAKKLEDSPYHVVPASSGESGLTLARELKPYAVTLDIMMPKRDGWTVLRELKADDDTRDIPVLILSFLDNRILGFSLGASAYLTKPVEQRDLLQSLDRFASGLRKGQGHVLVVEDDPDARELYRQLLTAEGVRVVETVDGAEALEAIERELPALVILDLMMPRLDGFEVAARLRANPRTRNIPVVVVTAKELNDEDLEKLSQVRRVIRKGDMAETLIVKDLRALLDGSLESAEEARA